MAYLANLGNDLVAALLRWRRYCFYSLAAILALLLSGSISLVEPKWSIVLFGLNEEDTSFVRDALSQLPNLDLRADASPVATATVLNRHNAFWGISRQQDKLVLTRNFSSNQASLGPITYLLAIALGENPLSIRDTVTLDAQVRSMGGEIGSLPRTTARQPPRSWIFVSSLIGLLVAFLPFFMAIDLIAKDAQSRALYVQLAARQGGFLSYVFAKLTFCVGFAMAILFLLLLSAQQFFGVTPKAGLGSVLAMQAASATVSASYGVATAMFAGGSRQTYGAIAAYFLMLTIFGGFLFPLESAAGYIQTLSLVVPLSYSLPPIENWLIHGQSVWEMPNDFVRLSTLAAFALALVIATAAIRRRAL